MGRIFHPLFALLAFAARQERARQVTYRNGENRIFRVGRRLGVQLKELMSFIGDKKLRRCIRLAEQNHTKSKPPFRIEKDRTIETSRMNSIGCQAICRKHHHKSQIRALN